MRRYPKYKDSGVELIGDIPENWELIRLGDLGVFSSSGIDKKLDENEERVRMVNYTDIIQNRKYSSIQNSKKEYMVVTTPLSKLSEHRLKKGDLVFIPSSETQEDLGYSSLIDFEESDIVFSYHIIRFQFKKEVCHYFKKYLTNYHLVLNQFSSEAKGTTRQIVGRNVFRNIKVVLPPLTEQQQIVTYLDQKTSIIDRIISNSEKKIETLREQRTCIINHTVTKGLNPKVKMKDSGVEWIGEIPEGWGVIPLRLLYEKIGSGITPRGGSEVYVEEGVVFIRSQNVHFGGLRIDDVVKIEKNTHNKMRGTWVFKEDVLLNITGGSIGRCCVVKSEEPMNVNQHVCIVRPNKVMSSYFLNLTLQSFIGQTQIEFYITGGNREGLSIENIKNFKITVPKISEQLQIVTYLDQKTKEIDDLILSEQKRIQLMKEYRQSLISEVVTGKIKVTEK